MLFSHFGDVYDVDLHHYNIVQHIHTPSKKKFFCPKPNVPLIVEEDRREIFFFLKCQHAVVNYRKDRINVITNDFYLQSTLVYTVNTYVNYNL